MATRTQIYKEVLREYDALRTQKAAELRERREAIYTKVPRLEAIERELSLLGVSTAKLVLMQPESREAALAELQEKQAELKAERDKLLTERDLTYDLLQLVGERAEDALYGADCCGISVSEETCSAFCETFRQHADRLEAAYDETVLRNELNAVLRPLEDAVAEARFEAASAAALHEFAKEVFEIWQTGGVFARRRALKELRARAGFRLESHRIGNYVAKTFDLANEAQVRFAAAQQQLFKEDVSYKLRPGLYGEIYRLLLP